MSHCLATALYSLTVELVNLNTDIYGYSKVPSLLRKVCTRAIRTVFKAIGYIVVTANHCSGYPLFPKGPISVVRGPDYSSWIIQGSEVDNIDTYTCLQVISRIELSTLG